MSIRVHRHEYQPLTLNPPSPLNPPIPLNSPFSPCQQVQAETWWDREVELRTAKCLLWAAGNHLPLPSPLSPPTLPFPPSLTPFPLFYPSHSPHSLLLSFCVCRPFVCTGTASMVVDLSIPTHPLSRRKSVVGGLSPMDKVGWSIKQSICSTAFYLLNRILSTRIITAFTTTITTTYYTSASIVIIFYSNPNRTIIQSQSQSNPNYNLYLTLYLTLTTP